MHRLVFLMKFWRDLENEANSNFSLCYDMAFVSSLVWRRETLDSANLTLDLGLLRSLPLMLWSWGPAHWIQIENMIVKSEEKRGDTRLRGRATSSSIPTKMHLRIAAEKGSLHGVVPSS